MPTILSKIEISNFKSFRGKNSIEALEPEQWTAIIGKNGSGKSNFMDAIAFALGEVRAKLRCNSAADCVYQDQHGNMDQVKGTNVQVTLKFDDETTQTFKRSIVDNKIRHFIDEERVSGQDYIEALKDHGLNIESSNFLVYQGNIDAIIDATGTDRATMFEEISRSIEFKEEYDRTQKQHDLLANTAKNLIHERRSLKAEKKAIESVMGNMEDQDESRQKFETIKIEYYLFNIHCIDLYIENLRELIEKAQEKMKKLKKDKIKKNDETEESKKSYKEKLHDFEFAEKEQEKNTEKKKKLDKELLTEEEEIEMKKKILSRNEKMLENYKNCEEQRKKNLTIFKKELQLIKNKKQECNKNKTIELDEDKRKEYNKLLGQVSAKCVEHFESLKAHNRTSLRLTQQKKHEALKLKEVEKKQKEEQKKEEKINSTIKEVETLITELTERNDTIKKIINDRRSSILSDEELNDSRTQLQETKNKLAAIEIDEQWKTQQIEGKRIVEILQNEIYGVHDRFSKLCYPNHDRYTTAIIRVCGPKYSAIIVDNSQVALKCIECLNRHKLFRETLLPIQDLANAILDEQLRSIQEPPMVSLIYDVLKFDNKYEPVVRHVVKSTLVCETDEHAKQVAYEHYKKQNDGSRRRTYNAVSLNGTFFKKNGSFTGGLGINKKIDKTKYDELVSKKKEILDKLLKHNDSASEKAQSSIKEFEAQISANNKRLSGYKEQKRLSMAEKSTIETSFDDLEEERRSSEERLKILEEEERTLSETMQRQQKEYETQIKIIKQETFAGFCSKNGLKNIEEYEESIKTLDEKNEKLAELEARYNRVKELHDFEENNMSYNEKIVNFEAKIKEFKDDIAEIIKKNKKRRAVIERLENEIKAYEENVKTAEEELINCKADNEKRTAELRAIKRELLKVENEIVVFKRKKSEKSREKHDLLLKAKMTAVNLPLLEGSLEDLFPEDTSQESWEEIEQRESLLIFDFSQLPEEKLNETDKENIEKILEDYKKELSTLTDELKIATIANADEKLEAVKDKLFVNKKKIEENEKVMAAVDKLFKVIKAKRRERFMKFFKTVETSLADIYQTLIGSDNAQAVLITHNEAEPYLHGVDYECVPDSKKRMPMSSLSGGERTMAGLALLFALRSASPPPFLIMDEIDGPLDKNHIYHLKNYFANLKTKQQIILISLNFNVYLEADRIIGVAKVMRNYHESKLFVLNNKKYPTTIDPMIVLNFLN